uniref:ApaG domain-containing protein n=1 Tax=Echinostoma caproni TaxID=27848 RepID=A0A183AFR3_9TREM
LESIGQLQPPSEDVYEPGQLFLHKHFGYRGVILQSWPAKLFDRNMLSLKATFAKPLNPHGIFLLTPVSTEPSLLPTDHLRRWIEARKQSLEVTSVHREVTEGIRTTTVPFFMGRRLVVGERPEKHIRYWRYLIRLENLSSERVQLRERFWKVFSITGSLESVRGKGVVGMTEYEIMFNEPQPILAEDSRVFQYHSHVQVPVPWAHMWGSFRFEKSNGSSLDVKIPSFPLCDRAYWSGAETATHTE